MFEIIGKHTKATVFTDNIEESAYAQILNVCNQSVFKDVPIRIMPDVHAGAGCVIGFTMPITDFVIPNLVGVDIGCGVTGINFKEIRGNVLINTPDFLSKFDQFIRENIPHGFNVREKPAYIPNGLSKRIEKICKKLSIDEGRVFSAVGSLGSGNHYIELGQCWVDDFWLTVHSGSRNFGLKIANYHQDIAKTLNPTVSKDLAYLTGHHMDEYLEDMYVAQEYAYLNRKTMLDYMFTFFSPHIIKTSKIIEINTTHNYINPVDKILRKGAVSAKNGEKLFIPISMKDGVLLCEGLGNSDWNFSAPHGAGRVLARGAAKSSLNMEDFKEDMKKVWTSCVSYDTIDESPRAYKKMEDIVGHIKETVNVVDIIKPIYNFKSN